MTSDMSVIGLLFEASIPVQAVMLLLIIASLMSWSIIFTKRRLISRTKDASDDFEANFWSGGDLNTLYQSATRERGGSVGMSSIFEAGFREFNRAMQQGDINRPSSASARVSRSTAGVAAIATLPGNRRRGLTATRCAC